MKLKSLIMFFVCVGSFLPFAQAEDQHIDPELQQVLGGFLRNLREEQKGQSEKLDQLLAQMSSMKVSPCLLVGWLRDITQQLARPGAKVEYLLGDEVDNHLRTIDETMKEIMLKLKVGENASDEVKMQVRELAITVAANELSLRTIRGEIIPNLLDATRKNTERIDSVETKVEFLTLKYLADYKSLCDRVAQIERDMQRLKQNGSPGIAQVQGEVQATYYEPIPMPELDQPTPAPSPTVDLDHQRWEPDAYVTARSLCSRAVLKESNYTYYARVVTNRGVVVERRFGDIYINCSKKVVMLLKE